MIDPKSAQQSEIAEQIVALESAALDRWGNGERV
jgi:hypothetical protein